jgi:hypothetical protein
VAKAKPEGPHRAGPFKIGGPGREAVEVDAWAVRPNPGERGAFVVQGIDRRGGRVVRVPIPGATVDGQAVPVPTPEEQRALASEATPPKA